MRVLMVHNDYLLPGGETLTVHEQVAGLRGQGVEVSLLMADNARWEAGSQLRAAAGILYERAAHERVAGLIATFRPDVIHTHNLFPTLGAAAVRAIGASKLPWVQHLHNYRGSCLSANHFRDGADCLRCTKAATAIAGIKFGCYRGSRAQSAASSAFDVSRRAVMAVSGSPHVYVAVSESMRETMLRRYLPGAHIEVLYNAIDTDASARAVRAAKVREGVVFVGRLVEEKGVRLALAALDLLPDVPVTFIGDGALFDEVITWAARRSRVRVERSLGFDDVLEAVASARVALALPQWEEPFGRTAVEALSVGTPVVATSRGAMPELLGGNRGSLLSASPTPRNVADAIEAWLQEPAEAAKTRAEGLVGLTAATFGMVSGIERLIKIYQTARERA